MIEPADVSALPDGAVLVHLGPPKTGTTSLQKSMALRRPDLAQHGVLYPGSHHRARLEVDALLDRGGDADGPDAWTGLAEAVVAAPDRRVCVSSESLARARLPHVRRAVASLGPDRVHVLAVARRLDRVLPSAWQQRVKGSGETLPYADWLAEVLGDDEDAPAARTFWRHHDLGQVLGPWLRLLGPERVVVVVADEGDRSLLLRVTERLLGLPEHLLDGGPADENTSLSHERAELLRRFTLAVGDRGTDAQRAGAVRTVMRALFDAPPTAGDHRLPPLPAWAQDRLVEQSRRQVRAVRRAGTVVGRPRALVVEPEPDAPDLGRPPDGVPVDAAVAALAALWRPPQQPAPPPETSVLGRALRRVTRPGTD